MRYRRSRIRAFGALWGALGALAIMVAASTIFYASEFDILFAALALVGAPVAALGALVGLASSSVALLFVRRSRALAVASAALAAGVITGVVLQFSRSPSLLYGLDTVLELAATATLAGGVLALLGLRWGAIRKAETPAERLLRTRYGRTIAK